MDRTLCIYQTSELLAIFTGLEITVAMYEDIMSSASLLNVLWQRTSQLLDLYKLQHYLDTNIVSVHCLLYSCGRLWMDFDTVY